MTSKKISGAVGPWEDKKSVNNSADVKTIQTLLRNAAKVMKESSIDPGTPDGKIAKKAASSNTIRAIKRFQKFFLSSPDGRVDPGGKSFTALTSLEIASQGTVSWMNVAQSQKGVKEYSGSSAANPSIVMYLSSCKTTKHFTRSKQLSDETSWCAAFVNWVLRKSRLKGLDTPWAPSWERYGYELTLPLYGAITVVKRSGGSGRHVAFFVKSSGNTVTLLGGNQGNRVCEKSFPASSVVCYRWPRPITIGVPISPARPQSTAYV